MKEKTILAKLFIIDEDGLILVLRRSKSDNRRPLTWDLPGGEVEFGEEPNMAAIREVDEETGLKIKDAQVFNISTTNNGDYVVRLFYYYFTKDKNVTLSFEHDQLKWVTKEEFPNLDAPAYYKEAITHLPSRNY